MGAVLSLGSINADFQVRVDRPLDGPGTVLARDLLRTSGGKAANVAVLACRLGAEARLLGWVGEDDLADQALAGPRRAGVDVTGVRRAPGAATSVASIAVTPDGDKTIVLTQNANETPTGADRLAERMAQAPPGSVLVADLEVPAADVVAAARTAGEAGMPVVLDPAPADRVTDELLARADHVTPDHREAGTLTGIDATSVAGACRAAEQLHRRCAGTAYVKLSSGGCALATGDGTTVVEAAAGLDVVDTTGAGDAFAGALAWALLGGHPPDEAAALAVAASACAVGTYGSQEAYPTLDQLSAMRARLPAAPAPAGAER